MRAEYNGPPRRFGNVETHDPEWETDEDLAPAGSQDNASWKTNVNASDNVVSFNAGMDGFSGLLSVPEPPIVATVAELPFIRGSLAEKSVCVAPHGKRFD